jgi:ADP-ribose pyrophosphatase
MSSGEGEEVPEDPKPFPGFSVLRSERIYTSAWCGLRRDFLALPGGQEQEYHVFEIPDAVVVVPILRNGKIVMIGQYRYPHGRTHWEVPAGRIAAGETPRECAERELLEEAGCRAGRIQEMPGFYPTNGISPHFAHAFAALDCERISAPQPDASEQIVVSVFTTAQVEALLSAGRIRDGFSALALLYFLRLASSRPAP